MFNCVKKNHSQGTSIFGWNLDSLCFLAFSLLVSKEKVLSKLLNNTAKSTSMQDVFYICDVSFLLLSLQPLFPTPPFSHKLCVVRPLQIPCLVGRGTLLGLPVTYLTASTWLWALSPTLRSLTSPWPSSSSHACSRLYNYFSPCTYPSQRLPGEVWDQSSYSASGTRAPLLTTCLAVAPSTVCSLDALWSGEHFVPARCCWGLTWFCTDNCEHSSRSHLTKGGTTKRTDQTVSKQVIKSWGCKFT